MSSLAKLSIRGVRAFSPDDDEQVRYAETKMICSSSLYSIFTLLTLDPFFSASDCRVLFSVYDYLRTVSV
jgi:hypothetical protein